MSQSLGLVVYRVRPIRFLSMEIEGGSRSYTCTFMFAVPSRVILVPRGTSPLILPKLLTYSTAASPQCNNNYNPYNYR